jgi:acyl-CoA reductase-like NAD-dependent aldehyde dehydrogenase
MAPAIAAAGVKETVTAGDAVAACAAAFEGWARTPADIRANILNGAAGTLAERRGDLRASAEAELGASPAWIDFNLDIACDMLRAASDLAHRVGEIETSRNSRGVEHHVRRDPVGVVLGIAPWNAPVTLAVRAVAAPLACGNPVVLKASELCPGTHRLVVEALRAAGLPEGALEVVSTLPQDTEACVQELIADPAVRRINFTGSTRVGRRVAGIAAQHVKPCLLELSGNAPLIVLEDADLDRAADAAAFSAFFNQGQVCMSTERVIVTETVADAFVVKLVERTRTLTERHERGDSAWLGRLINADAALRLNGLIEDARKWGGRLLIGGQSDGSWMAPAVIDRVSSAMRIYREEIFGPIVGVLRVTDEDEAIAIANDSDMGLSASVFSRDRDRAARVADQLETGMCHINGPTVHDDPSMPFGGMKASGYGRFGGTAALHEFTEIRWIADHSNAELKLGI